MNRRRFLSLSACFAAAPMAGYAGSWRGQALGAEVSITLSGPRRETDVALAQIPHWLEQIEAEFSLYRASELTRLNTKGQLRASPLFHVLWKACQHAWALTGGLFDPTIQPLWQALARGEDPDAARALIDWNRVRATQDGLITLAPGQQLTFNGIAQGFATDTIADLLAARGFGLGLVNIGEHRALGGPHRLLLVDPVHGALGQRSLTQSAIATSAPGALKLGSAAHILSPDGRPPLWSSVSIEAANATLADALSTAAVFMDLSGLQTLKQAAGLVQITVVDPQGNLRTL